MQVKILSLLILVATFCSCDDETPQSFSLEGTWRWRSSCGGVAGCAYSSSYDRRTLTITDTLLEFNEGGRIILSVPYTIKSVKGDERSKTYEIEFSDGAIWTSSIKNNLLTVEEVFVTSVYKRSLW